MLCRPALLSEQFAANVGQQIEQAHEHRMPYWRRPAGLARTLASCFAGAVRPQSRGARISGGGALCRRIRELSAEAVGRAGSL